MYAFNLFSVCPTNCNKNLNISLWRLKSCNSWSSKCGNREIKDCDAIRGMCILELKVLQIIHFNKLGIASKRSFFQIPTPLYWYRVFFPSKQFEFISRLMWYFHGVLIFTCLWNFKTLSTCQRHNNFCCSFLQDIINEWDYELAWHE